MTDLQGFLLVALMGITIIQNSIIIVLLAKMNKDD